MLSLKIRGDCLSNNLIVFVQCYDTFYKVFQKNTKGFQNTLLVCHEKRKSETCNNSTESDKIIVRIFGGNLGEMARQSEIEIMKIVSEKGIMPKVYGR